MLIHSGEGSVVAQVGLVIQAMPRVSRGVLQDIAALRFESQCERGYVRYPQLVLVQSAIRDKPLSASILQCCYSGY